MSIGPIGLDIRNKRINLVQMHRLDDGQVMVKAFKSFAYQGTRNELLNSPKKLKKTLWKIIEDSDFEGKTVVVSMDSRHVRILPISYSNTEGVEAAIGRMVEDRVSEASDEFVIDYVPVRSETLDGEQSALVALADQSEVMNYLKVLTSMGFNVEALDINSGALTRLIKFVSVDSDFETNLVVKFGERRSYITVISGNRMLHDQEISFGEQQLLEHFVSVMEMTETQVIKLFDQYGRTVISGKKMGSSDGDKQQEFAHMINDIAKPFFMQLADEISRVMMFVSSQTRGKSISKIYLCGNIVSYLPVDSLLARMLDVSVMPIYAQYSQLFQHHDESFKDIVQTSSSMEIAVGLALRGMKDD